MRNKETNEKTGPVIQAWNSNVFFAPPARQGESLLQNNPKAPSNYMFNTHFTH
jgi:hypothetical protein